MQRISKLEIAEVKAMIRPPPLVKLVMKAICILFDVEPVMKISKEGKMKPSYWRASISPAVLGDPNFPERLEKFDRTAVSNEKI
jgi:dynein heavy chain